jgi:hypothetical protein
LLLSEFVEEVVFLTSINTFTAILILGKDGYSLDAVTRFVIFVHMSLSVNPSVNFCSLEEVWYGTYRSVEELGCR